MDEILTLVLTSVITFFTYEAMRALFDKIKEREETKDSGKETDKPL